MYKVNRRDFLNKIGVISFVTLLPTKAEVESEPDNSFVNGYQVRMENCGIDSGVSFIKLDIDGKPKYIKVY